jgi:hypothetical protein
VSTGVIVVVVVDSPISYCCPSFSEQRWAKSSLLKTWMYRRPYQRDRLVVGRCRQNPKVRLMADRRSQKRRVQTDLELTRPLDHLVEVLVVGRQSQEAQRRLGP